MVGGGGPASPGFGRKNAGREVVARVLELRANVALAHGPVVIKRSWVAVDFRKRVGRFHIAVLKLARNQGRAQQFHLQLRREVVLQVQARLVGVELHPLAAVVGDEHPRKLIGPGRERGLPGFGREAVIVVRDNAEQAERGPLHVLLLAQTDVHESLGIVESGVVTALGLFQRTEHVLRVLVAHAGQVAHAAVGRAGFGVGRAAHQAGRERGREFLGRFVIHAQHRGQFVAVLGLPAAAAKLHLLHQIGVDKAQPLLLRRGNEKRPVNLEAVDIHQVLVVITTAHVICAT